MLVFLRFRTNEVTTESHSVNDQIFNYR